MKAIKDSVTTARGQLLYTRTYEAVETVDTDGHPRKAVRITTEHVPGTESTVEYYTYSEIIQLGAFLRQLRP